MTKKVRANRYLTSSRCTVCNIRKRIFTHRSQLYYINRCMMCLDARRCISKKEISLHLSQISFIPSEIVLRLITVFITKFDIEVLSSIVKEAIFNSSFLRAIFVQNTVYPHLCPMYVINYSYIYYNSYLYFVSIY